MLMLGKVKNLNNNVFYTILNITVINGEVKQAINIMKYICESTYSIKRLQFDI